MSYATLELFPDTLGLEPRLGVEGFGSMEGLANFALFAAERLYPRWAGLRADHHNDMREVLSMLDTIEQTARFLIGLEYPDAEVRSTLREQFPAGDADAAIADAHEHKTRLESEVAIVQRREADAAVASELDLSKSMHDPRP